MERISSTGSLSYRTKLLDRGQAERFAAVLIANPRFCDVLVCESDRAKSERRHFVEFLPANPERRADMLDRQQQARADRAALQLFEFLVDKDAGRPFVWVYSHASGETYELDIEGRSCSCPDHLYHCQSNGLRCKHAIAWLDHVASGGEIRTW